MAIQFRKYFNGTCNPKDFSKVIEAFGAPDYATDASAEIEKFWKEILVTTIDEKRNTTLLDKIHHQIALEESTSVARRFTLYRNLLKIAAVLIVSLIISTAMIYTRSEKPVYTSLIETVTTPFGARTTFKLPDGSQVWLNSGSTISFPKQYAEVRDVKLSGQAYFEVVKNGKPFLVKTVSGTIEVMGTSFDVKAYKDDNFETTLVEGSVLVKNNTNEVATLKPGQQSIINLDNKLILKDVNTALSTSWREGKLIFVKEPFVNVARELERWYNVKIELQCERLNNLGYTGTIEMETFGEVLELINTTTPITYKFNKNTRVLKISGR